MSKFEPALQHALATWRTALGHGRADGPVDAASSEVHERQVTVLVTYRGDVAPLRAAGLRTGYDGGGRISGLIAFRDLDALAALPEVIAIAMEPRVHIALDTTIKEMRVPWKVPPTAPWPGKGGDVIVAVIDTGIDIFHDSFRKDGNKTRILELWDQSATTGGSAPTAPFTIGRVYSKGAIEAALNAGPPFVSLDTIGHGTHVAGIAAGNGRQDDRCNFPGRFTGVAPDADLVIVKAIGIPSPAIREAFQWCAQAPTRHAGRKGVVINCSFGSDVGPHDGTGVLDGFVDEILRPTTGGPPTGVAIVVAGGNAGASEVRETGAIAVGATTTVPFYIANGSTKLDLLEVWYNDTASLTAEIIAPAGAGPGSNTTGPVTVGTVAAFPIGTMTLNVSSSSAPHASNKRQISVSITLTVTAPATAPPAGATVRPGVWQLKLTHAAGSAATWDAWFQTEHGDVFPTFRQPSEPAAILRRSENTIGEPGSSRNAITVASYHDVDGQLAASSSRGPTNQPASRPPGEFKPTIAAPGVGVTAARSRSDPAKNSSCCNQLVVDKTGTSMAAPHVAGLVALMFQKNSTLTFEQVRTILQHSARIDGIPAAEVPPPFGPAPPPFPPAPGIRANHLWGSGKVNAALALTETALPAGGGGGGGGGGGPILFSGTDLGFTPHTLLSRLGDWRDRLGPRPGLMLFAALVSDHVDEVLRLVNQNPRVGAVWRRHGGPVLVRRLLNGAVPQDGLLPRRIDGCDVADLLARLLPMLVRFGGRGLRADINRFSSFTSLWPGADLARLDAAALDLARPPP